MKIEDKTATRNEETKQRKEWKEKSYSELTCLRTRRLPGVYPIHSDSLHSASTALFRRVLRIMGLGDTESSQM